MLNCDLMVAKLVMQSPQREPYERIVFLSFAESGEYPGGCAPILLGYRRPRLFQFSGLGPVEPVASCAGERLDLALLADNGALMRLAPIAIAYANRPATAIVLAGKSSRVTHGARESVDCCRYFAGLLAGLIDGAPREKVLSPMYCPVPGLWDSESLVTKVQDIANGSFADKRPPAIKGSGYVVDCLEAALWAFFTTDTFRDAILAAVNLGDDADTTAAVCGQIAGAHYGASGIPADWLRRLAMRCEIESLGKGLISLW